MSLFKKEIEKYKKQSEELYKFLCICELVKLRGMNEGGNVKIWKDVCDLQINELLK